MPIKSEKDEIKDLKKEIAKEKSSNAKLIKSIEDLKEQNDGLEVKVGFLEDKLKKAKSEPVAQSFDKRLADKIESFKIEASHMLRDTTDTTLNLDFKRRRISYLYCIFCIQRNISCRCENCGAINIIQKLID